MDTASDYLHFRTETDDDNIVWLNFDKADAGTNVFSPEVLEELDSVLQRITEQPPRGMVILSGKPNGFIAGADIREFVASVDAPREEIAAMMESLSARCIRVTGLVFGLAAAAIAGGSMEARMLSSDEPYGIVTTFTSDIPDKVYPAYIAVIDGRNVQSTSSVGGLSGRKHTFRRIWPPQDPLK